MSYLCSMWHPDVHQLRASLHLCVMVAAGILLAMPVCAEDAPPVQPSQISTFTTSIGSLLEKHSMAFGVDIDGGFSGVIEVKPGEAFKLGDSIKILAGAKSKGPPLEITVVQDTASGQWLATDGILYFHADGVSKEDVVPMLIEEHVVHIIGGEDNPFQINKQPFSDCSVEIKEGQVQPYKMKFSLKKIRLDWTTLGIAAISLFALYHVLKKFMSR